MLNLIAIKLAQTIQLAPSDDNFGNLASLTIPNIIAYAVTFVLIISALIFFFMLIFGGIKWILSGGDKGKTESARNQITAALIGLVIVFSAWAIITLLGTIFGITNILNFQVSPISVG